MMNRAHNLAVGAIATLAVTFIIIMMAGAVYVLWHFIEKWW